MGLGIEVLQSVSLASVAPGKGRDNHSSQIVFIHESAITSFAVIFEMITSLHMLIRSLLSVEFHRARFAGNFRRPMSNSIHMPVGSVLRQKLPSTSLTFISRCPVVGVIHMLVTSALRGEDSGASLAFTPVVIILQMVGEVLAIPEFVTALLALEHLCNLSQTMKIRRSTDAKRRQKDGGKMERKAREESWGSSDEADELSKV